MGAWESPPTPRRGRVLARRVGLAALTVLGFGLTAALIAPLSHRPYGRELHTKTDLFDQTRDEYDMVFVGSSLVESGIDTPLLDRLLAEQGHPVRAFNLALSRMIFSEAVYVVRDLLDDPPARLRTIVMELQPFDFDLFRLYHDAARMRYWHDWATTRMVCGAITWRAEPWPATLRDIGEHVELFAARTVNLGTFALALGEVLSPPLDATGRQELDLARTQDGYVALEDRLNPTIQAMGRAFAADPSELIEDTRSFGLFADGRKEVDAYQVAVLEKLVAEAGRAGITLVFLIMPITDWQRVHLNAHDLGLLPHLIALNDPRAWPRLFRPPTHFDRHHLSKAGAEIATRAVATALVPILEGRDQPTR